MGIPGRAKRGGDGAGGRGGEVSDGGGRDAPSGEALEELSAEFIRADGRDGQHGDAEAVEVIGDVEGRAAGECAVREQVPEDLAEAEDGSGHRRRAAARRHVTWCAANRICANNNILLTQCMVRNISRPIREEPNAVFSAPPDHVVYISVVALKCHRSLLTGHER
jgi:hypothetical protein